MSSPTFASHSSCPIYAFRCTYGACLPGSAECNGVSDCFDNSDELSLKCPGVKETHLKQGNCTSDKYQCADGSCIHVDQVCNGRRECADGADETVKECANHFCPAFAFRCDYGACITGLLKCDGAEDCADGSDESEKLCGVRPTTAVPPTSTTMTPIRERPVGSCSVPLIENGRVLDFRNATYNPGAVIQNGEMIRFECIKSILVGQAQSYCISGVLYGSAMCAKSEYGWRC